MILLVENQTGWKNLIKLVSKAHLEGFYYKPRMDKDLLREHHEGLIALSACLGGEVARALTAGQYEEAKRIALEHQEIFGKGNYFLEIQKHPNIPESENIEPLLVKLSKDTGIPLVATQDSHYTHSEDAEYHDVLLAVQTGNKLTDDDRMSMKSDDFSILSPEAMAEKFANVPGGAGGDGTDARDRGTVQCGARTAPPYGQEPISSPTSPNRREDRERLPPRAY